jgi:putative endonuclease
MAYFAYVLRSLSYKTHYYGSAEDVEKRLQMHNAGKVRYTRGRRPWVICYSESFATRAEAVRRERFFKSIDGYLYLKSIGVLLDGEGAG